jgi:hypothetical protein
LIDSHSPPPSGRLLWSFKEEMGLMDSCTTNTILREIKYFQILTQRSGNVLTIAGRDTMIVGSGRATITFPNGIQVTIEDVLLYPTLLVPL